MACLLTALTWALSACGSPDVSVTTVVDGGTSGEDANPLPADSSLADDAPSPNDGASTDAPLPDGASHANGPLPGGKAFYVFAAVRIKGASSDFVKIGQVTFSTDTTGKDAAAVHRVTWSGWFWLSGAGVGQAGFSGAVGVGAHVGADCDQTGKTRYSPDGSLFNTGTNSEPASIGELRAASSYTGNATEVKAGDYDVVTSGSPAYVHIRWDDGSTEDWNLTSAPAGIQKLEPRSSSLGYTAGVAAGSNTPLSKRVHPSTLTSHAKLGFLPLPQMTQCSTATWVINESSYRDANSPCSCNPKRSYMNNWLARISDTDRRDLWHSWCECLAVDNPWYGGGSHQRMMLQALDDAGHFRGYVGVEADTNFGHADLYNYLDF